MTGAPDGEDRREDEDVHRDAVERAQRTSDEIEARLSALAASVARTEESLADIYEDSARIRPHAAERLQKAAREARTFAVHEREESRRWVADDPPTSSPSDPPTSSPSDPPT